jgi:hypothetical protein
MCGVTEIAIASAVLTIASTAAGAYMQYEAQNQAAAAAQQQANYMTQLEIQRMNAETLQMQVLHSQQEESQLLAMRNLAEDSMRALTLSETQFARQIDAMDVEYNKVARQTKEGAATALVRASESGVGGLSVGALLADFAVQEYDARLTLDKQSGYLLEDYTFRNQDIQTSLSRAKESYTIQSRNDMGQLSRSLLGSELQSSFNLAQINDPSRMPTGGSLLSAGLQTASGVAEGLNTLNYAGVIKPSSARVPTGTTGSYQSWAGGFVPKATLA